METCAKATFLPVEAVSKDLTDLAAQAAEILIAYPERVVACGTDLLHIPQCLLDATKYATGRADMLATEVAEDLLSLPKSAVDLLPVITECTANSLNSLKNKLATLALSPLAVTSCLIG